MDLVKNWTQTYTILASQSPAAAGSSVGWVEHFARPNVCAGLAMLGLVKNSTQPIQSSRVKARRPPAAGAAWRFAPP